MINVKYAIKGIQPQFLQMQDLKNITGQEGFAQLCKSCFYNVHAKFEFSGSNNVIDKTSQGQKR